MKKILPILLTLQCIFVHSQNLQWINSIGGSKDEVTYTMAVDSSGNVYTAGYFMGSIDFDSGPGTYWLNGDNDTSSIFILKTNSYGNLIWAKEIRAVTTWTGSNTVSLALDKNSNLYLTGHYFNKVDFNPGSGVALLYTSPDEHCAFALSLNQAGGFRWVQRLTDFLAIGQCITTDNDGNIYAGGAFANVNDFDPGPATYTLNGGNYYNTYISKLDSLGNFIWAVGVGGTDKESIHAIKTDNLGNIYSTGYFKSVNADFDPGSGVYNLGVAGSQDIFILKLNAQGSFIWAKQIRGPLDEEATGLVLDPLNNIYLTGYFEDNTDFDPSPAVYTLSATSNYNPFVGKYDSDGNFMWAKQIKSPDIGTGNSICLEPNTGHIITTGFVYGTADFDPGPGIYNLTSNGGTDVYVSKLDNDGNFICATLLGGIGYDQAYTVQVDAAGNIIVGGGYVNTVDFDPGPANTIYTSNGAYDSFVFKLSRCGMTTGGKELAIQEIFSVFPNPCSGRLNIKNSLTVNSKITIRNALGETIYSDKWIEKNEEELNLSTFANGLYFLEASSDFGPVITKIILLK